MQIQEAWTARSRERALCIDRAGTWPLGTSRELQSAYVRKKWRSMATALLVGLGATPVVLLFPQYTRQFIAGAWIATLIAALSVSVFVGSGSAYRSFGADAERWTAEELWKCRSSGWKSVSHIDRDGWDIDHVAVGPSGVLVVQTKWTSERVVIGPELRSIATTIKDVRADARSIGLLLLGRDWEKSTRSVVVYWGPWVAALDEPGNLQIDGTTVLAGTELKSWLDRHAPDSEVSHEKQVIAWSKLTDYVSRHEASSPQVPVRSIGDRLTDIWRGVVAGFIVFTSLLLVSTVVPVPAAIGVSIGSAFLFGAVYRRFDPIRLWLLGGTAGALATAVLLAFTSLTGKA